MNYGKFFRWFISNKLSLNVTKTKYSFFSKPSKKDNIPLALPELYIDWKQPPEVFCKKGVLRNFVKFTEKHLCQRHVFNKVAGLRPATLLKKSLWHRCFPVNFAKFLRTPFFTEHLRWLLLIDNNQIQQSELIKILGVFLDENLTCKERIKYIENKIAKNIGIIFRSKPYLIKRVYYLYTIAIFSYMLTWGNTYLSNLKKINRQQKHLVRIIYNKMKYESVRELPKSMYIKSTS